MGCRGSRRPSEKPRACQSHRLVFVSSCPRHPIYKSTPSPSTIPPPARPGNPSSVRSTTHPADRHRASTGERGGSDRSRLLLDSTSDAYELATYHTPNAADERECRRRQKRERKREWLEAQDEMKFSHSIQFNAVPDWSSHYIAYSNLKKLCARPVCIAALSRSLTCGPQNLPAREVGTPEPSRRLRIPAPHLQRGAGRGLRQSPRRRA